LLEQRSKHPREMVIPPKASPSRLFIRPLPALQDVEIELRRRRLGVRLTSLATRSCFGRTNLEVSFYLCSLAATLANNHLAFYPPPLGISEIPVRSFALAKSHILKSTD